ncbi:helix-turn-helix transcriptional regulator [Streptomyces lunaelactis]|uniref:winged helix-turn-helix transcriptional regulator n=1 Tax=Streptomyces lunaelactis TaxID=1535768 RepID=UPI0015845FCD|nr:helix-turn-helix domain-containing protein [Streptomyces lunaelactis]NUK13330.1 helix-turn-helix transcriptional regulator [Streptomyces lunaelactis]NUL10581.1 helix-turn-helix transcriptional regulator [Streptomyces lunaelactis]NUL23816.1 helix-turn-helix transcriptional regulator [Streptomyces lunaelactis]
MTLPRDYTGQACSLARSLEVIGERWTLLIVRDAFYGVRRFGEFATHLRIPRAVLTERLTALTEAGVLRRVPGGGRREVYELTAKGVRLWPAVRGLTTWGDEHYAPGGPRRIFRHAADNAPIASDGHCTTCGTTVEVPDILVTPGPGLGPPAEDDDPVTAALTRPHRLLQPLRD